MSASHLEPIVDTVAQLTRKEKASLTSGADFWHTQAIERVGIPSLMMTDGPHGLRKQEGAGDALGLGASVPSTCFPPAVGIGSAFDPELTARVGAAIAHEAIVQDVSVVLGPGINIKRSPLCGRNFEYYSEDPLVAGVVGAGFIRGLQAEGVGGCVKHFAANNQETDRMRVSADIDERPLREIYLRAFQQVIELSRPWTVMCSYNRINGVYSSENPWLLTTVLRDEWGFDGLVMSDWGAVDNRVAGLPAGLDLEMPSSGGASPALIVSAVESGEIDESALDAAARRAVQLTRRAADRPAAGGEIDVDAHHALAREAAGRSIVLLKNEGGLLPLDAQDAEASIAVIGAFAKHPRYQGAGSSLINPTRLDTAWDAISAAAMGSVAYAPGFPLAGAESEGGDADALREDAVAAATGADAAIVFVGLPAADQSEGYDRTHIDLPADQLAVIDAVVAANPRTVVVLSNGGAVLLPFRDAVPAIVEGWLLGQAGGSATADVLFGAVNPSGKLTETIPLRIEDTPSFGNFPGESGHVRYGEGIFVGYRGYDLKRLDVAYPFGHGLSYTTFRYGEVTAEATDAGDVVVTVPVTNTGTRTGREIVQVYASLPGSAVERPVRALAGFTTVEIAAGEQARVEITLRRNDLAYWDVRLGQWALESGDYTIEVGASSRDIRATTTVGVAGDDTSVPLTLHSSVTDVLADEVAGPTLRAAMGSFLSGDEASDAATLKAMEGFPVGGIVGFTGPDVTAHSIQELLDRANAASSAGSRPARRPATKS